jgi:hypothetical protein
VSASTFGPDFHQHCDYITYYIDAPYQEHLQETLYFLNSRNRVFVEKMFSNILFKSNSKRLAISAGTSAGASIPEVKQTTSGVFEVSLEGLGASVEDIEAL